MADYRAISTGVASDLARWEEWNGLAWVAAVSLPTVANDVYSNGYTITLDIDFTASSIRNAAPPNGGTAGGGFTFGAGEVLTGDVVGGPSTLLTNATANRKFVIGNVTGPQTDNNYGCNITSSGGVDVVGNVSPGAGGGFGLHHTATGSGVSNIYGDIVGINGGNAAVVTGNGVVNILGRAYSVGTVSTGVAWAQAGVINIYEAYRGINNANGVMRTTSTGLIYVQRIINELAFMPLIETPSLFGVSILLSETGPVFVNLKFPRLNSPDETGILLSGTDQADPSDVRSGTSYASGLLTGTCAVPPAASVSLGVPVDATTGTASVDASELRDLILPSILSAITAP